MPDNLDTSQLLEGILTTIGGRIARLRKERGLSINKLAKLVGVSHQAVCQWEANKSKPMNGNLATLADTLDCSVRYLITGNQSRYDDFELLLLNALRQSGIQVPDDFRPPHTFRSQYRAGQITRRDCLRLIREEFVKLRLANEWLPSSVPLVATLQLVSALTS